MPVSKHSIKLSTDQPTPQELTKGSERGLELDFVTQNGPTLPIIDAAMSVIPECKRPRLLPIGEHVRWIVLRVQRDPANWQ